VKVQTAKQLMQLQKWAAQVNAQEQSGQTIKQWCLLNGISIKTFYQHRKRIHEEMLETIVPGSALQLNGADHSRSQYLSRETPVFAELPKAQITNASVTVRMDEYAIEIQNGADNTIVEHVLRLMARL